MIFSKWIKKTHLTPIFVYRFFQFGWTGFPDIANSIAMERLSLPNILVLNTSSLEHYLPETDPLDMDEAAVKVFLGTIRDQAAMVSIFSSPKFQR